MDTAKELGGTELLRGLSTDDVAAFAAIARPQSYTPGQIVYQEGTAGDSLYVIIEGSFAVRVRDEQGAETEVAHLKPGSYFGEMEVIGGMTRTAAIVAEADGRCYRFEVAELRGMLKRNDKLAAHFYEQICRELVRRLRNTTRDMGYFKARAN